MKGEKRPKLPRRDVQDMARTTKVVKARKSEVLSRVLRVERKSKRRELSRSRVPVFSGGDCGGREPLRRCSNDLESCAIASLMFELSGSIEEKLPCSREL